ncbi:MAG: RDD family protein [Acidimicrobiales bacterium]
MSDAPQTQPPGWYYAQGDPPGTQRYWDGSSWQGGPQPVPGVGADTVADTVAGGSNLAEPVKRIVARLIDGVIWAIISILVPSLFGAGPLSDNVGFLSGLLLSIVTGALVVVYEVVMVGNLGATLGKMALGLKVVNEDGSAADYMTGVQRMVLYIAMIFVGLIPILGSLLFLGIAVAGLVLLFTDAKRQTPWDKVGKTLVVENN